MTALRRVGLLTVLAVALVVFAALAMDAAEAHSVGAMLGVLVPVWATALLLGSMIGRAFEEMS